MGRRKEILQDFDAVKAAVSGSETIKEALERLGLKAWGKNYPALHRACAAHGLSAPTASLAKRREILNVARKQQVPLPDLLVENSSFSRGHLKRRLIAEGIIKYECALCGNDGTWNGGRLGLQLDHVNGVHNDNRLCNLRLLCPNCHSQTPTYAGKQKGREDERRKCKTCGKRIQNRSTWCITCYKIRDRQRDATKRIRKNVIRNKAPRNTAVPVRSTKIDWPSADDLSRMVWEESTTVIAQRLGVSDVAVAKRCRKLGIQKPPRGYWAKVAAEKGR